MADFGREPETDAVAILHRSIEYNNKMAARCDEEVAALEGDAKACRERADAFRAGAQEIERQLNVLKFGRDQQDERLKTGRNAIRELKKRKRVLVKEYGETAVLGTAGE